MHDNVKGKSTECIRHGKTSDEAILPLVSANEYQLVQSKLMAYKKVCHYQGVTQGTSHDG